MNLKSILHGIRAVLYFPLLLPASIVFFTVGVDKRRKIAMDVRHFWRRRFGNPDGKSVYSMWYTEMIVIKEFRNVFYCRQGSTVARVLALFMPPVSSLEIPAALARNYDGGLYIAHGTSTYIHANKIGRNLWCHQNVTIGMKGEGRPTIGDNVYIGCGAAIIGGVKIGNNVRIGANATVVDDVPDNAVVVSPKAKVVKIMSQTGGGN